MKKNIEQPGTQYLNDRFTYDPISGRLFWKERPKSDFKGEHEWKIFQSKWAGKETGYKCHNKHGEPKCLQVRIKINGRGVLLSAHRIIFPLMGVPIPDGFEVDHKDTNPFNNAWTNLRLATRAQNAANQKVHKRRKHKDLPKGVSYKRKLFRAQIGYGGKQIGLGSFQTAALAHAAYVAKAQELYGEFHRSN